MGVRSAVDLLKQMPLFAGVDEAHLQTLVFSSDELIVPPGRTVFEAGDPSTNALIIRQGEGVVIDPETGGVLALAGPGSMFGEQSLIASIPRQVTLNAKTEIEAIVIEQSVFLRLCGEFPEVGSVAQAKGRPRPHAANERHDAIRGEATMASGASDVRVYRVLATDSHADGLRPRIGTADVRPDLSPRSAGSATLARPDTAQPEHGARR